MPNRVYVTKTWSGYSQSGEPTRFYADFTLFVNGFINYLPISPLAELVNGNEAGKKRVKHQEFLAIQAINDLEGKRSAAQTKANELETRVNGPSKR